MNYGIVVVDAHSAVSTLHDLTLIFSMSAFYTLLSITGLLNMILHSTDAGGAWRV